MVSAREDRKACAGSGGNTGAESRRLGSSLEQSSTRVEQRKQHYRDMGGEIVAYLSDTTNNNTGDDNLQQQLSARSRRCVTNEQLIAAVPPLA
jgi:hypothetical protein